MSIIIWQYRNNKKIYHKKTI